MIDNINMVTTCYTLRYQISDMWQCKFNLGKKNVLYLNVFDYINVQKDSLSYNLYNWN